MESEHDSQEIIMGEDSELESEGESEDTDEEVETDTDEENELEFDDQFYMEENESALDDDDDRFLRCLESDSEDEGDEVNGSSFNWKKRSTFSPRVEDCDHPHWEIQYDIDENCTPLSIFRMFVDDEIVHGIVEESKYFSECVKEAKPTTLKNYQPFDANEFWQFIGLNTLMGLIQKCTIKDYWSKDPLLVTPIFGQTMSRNRFQDILRCLHFSNNNYPDPRNRFWKLGSFYTTLVANFQNAIIPGETLCVDESLMKYKGRLSFKQYMKSKRARFGVKFFLLVDSVSKCILDIFPYQGKKTQIEGDNLIKNFGFGGAVVLSLVKKFFGTFRKVVADNWFVSPILANALLRKNIYLYGTVKTTRKEMPQMPKKMKKGEVEVYSTNKLQIEQWEDRRTVVILSSCHTHQMHHVVSNNPKNTRMKPLSVTDYNKNMGAVDEIDKGLAPYTKNRKTIKWYKKVFFYFIALAQYNSFRLYKKYHDKATFKDFLRNLIREILDKYPSEARKLGRPSRYDPPLSLRKSGSHFPIAMIKVSDCCLCRQVGRRSTSKIMCKVCKKYLCVTANRNCFEDFHTLNTLPQRIRRPNGDASSQSL